MSTLTSRLHSDESGAIASAELVLAAPVFLLFWVLMFDLGMLQTAKLGLVVQNRTAAFLEAQHEICFAQRRQQAALSEKTSFSFSNCTRTPWEGASRFWRELDDAGRENLTRDLASAKMPELIEARTTTSFRFHDAVDWSRYLIADRFTVIEPATFTHLDEGFETGYDRTLVRRFSSGHGQLLDLFPNVFPGAR